MLHFALSYYGDDDVDDVYIYGYSEFEKDKEYFESWLREKSLHLTFIKHEKTCIVKGTTLTKGAIK